VKRWLDQSGNHNDAVGDCSAGGSCQNGALPAVDPAAINGLDAFACNLANSGATFKVADAVTLQFGTGDWAVAEVYQPPITDVTNGLGMWMKTGSPYMSIVQTSVTTLTLTDDGLQISISPTAGKFAYFIARGNAMSFVSSAGSATGGTTTGDISNPGSLVLICNDGSTGSPTQADIAEVVAVKGTLSDADQAKLVAYFKAKFAL
jgi:hypothetical protein